MRIKGYAHIFNLQTVLAKEAIVIIVNRLRNIGVPAVVADASSGCYRSSSPGRST